MSLNVGSAAWRAARSAWSEHATSSARALIAERAAAARASGHLTVNLGPGTHATPPRHDAADTRPWWGGRGGCHIIAYVDIACTLSDVLCCIASYAMHHTYRIASLRSETKVSTLSAKYIIVECTYDPTFYTSL